MPTIVARHKVGDIEAWLKGHKERKEIFAPAVSGFTTFQDTDDPKSVVLVLEVTDMEMLAEIIHGPKNAGLKVKHTVLEPIVMSMPVEL
ncbi:MAG TPA: hypothetical protein VFC67_16875 [Prolixibacteraceae bacterium]|nr:hypothetical protein [Prolixibacteraceae bacterium]